MQMFVWNVGNDGGDTIAITESSATLAREAIIARIDAAPAGIYNSEIRRDIRTYDPVVYDVGEPMIVLGGF